MSTGGGFRCSRAAPPQRVLVIVTRHIGDVLLTTPVVRSLKQAGGSSVDLLVFAGTGGFVGASSDVDRIPAVPPRLRLLEHLRFMAGLARRYDLALSLLRGRQADDLRLARSPAY